MTNQKLIELTKEQQFGIANKFGLTNNYDHRTKSERITANLRNICREIVERGELREVYSAYTNSEMVNTAKSVQGYLEFLSKIKQNNTPADDIPIMKANQLARKFVKGVEMIREEASAAHDKYQNIFPGGAITLANAISNAQPNQELNL